MKTKTIYCILILTELSVNWFADIRPYNKQHILAANIPP